MWNGALGRIRIHAVGSDGNPVTSAVVHLDSTGYFASPNARFVEYVLAPDNVRSELLTEPVKLADGFIERPTAPGLGITLDRGFADRYPYRAGVVEYA